MIKADSLTLRYALSQVIDYKWGDSSYGEDWDIVYPDLEKLTLEELTGLLIGYNLIEKVRDIISDESGIENLEEDFRSPEEFLEHSLDQRYITEEEIYNLIDDCDIYQEDLYPMMDGYIDLGNSYIDLGNSYIDLGNYYPDPTEIAVKLIGTCLTCCQVDGRTVVALTGGGMDMTWDICKAFMKLGSTPPVHYCNLPRLVGHGQSDEDKEVIEACNITLKNLIHHYQNCIDLNISLKK